MQKISDNLDLNSICSATVLMRSCMIEKTTAKGRYSVQCLNGGKIKWEDIIDNVVTTVGKDLALDTFLAGVSYTVTGPFMGLISSVSYTTGPDVSDTMSSHGGWVEAGFSTNYPLYTGTRKTCAWSAASGGSKSLSSPLNFDISIAGTVKGAFIIYGTGSVNTINDTNGVLYSAGLLSGGDRVVYIGDTLRISYSTSL